MNHYDIETLTYGLAVRAATVMYGEDWPGKCTICPNWAGGGWRVRPI